MFNTFICNNFCGKASKCGFSSKCFDLDLVYSEHCISLDPLQSFKHVMLPLIDVSNLSFNEFLNSLLGSINNNLDFKIEYGVHKRWLTFGMCPNIALLNKISIDHNIDIFVVCGDFPLRQIHNGKNLVRFGINDESLYNQAQRSIMRQTNRKIVIGLGGIGIYHPIDQPSENDFFVWNKLYDESIYFENINYLEEDIFTGIVAADTTRLNEIIEDSDALNDIAEDLDVSNEVFERTLSENQINTHSKSIAEFLEINSIKINGKIKILPSAFTSTDKIEMTKSHNDALIDGDGLNLNQTYDIDGFYAFSEMSLFAKVFKSCASISPHKQTCDKRTQKCIKNMYSYAGIRIFNSAYITKIAITEQNVVKFEMFLVAQASRGENPVEFDWEIIVRNAMEESRISPCFNESNGTVIHNGCMSQGLKNSMNSSRIASSKNIKAQNYRENYSNETFNCFLFHFEKILTKKVQDSGLLVSKLDIFIRAIGMKFLYAFNNFSDIWKAVKLIEEVIDINFLPQRQVILDFCVVTTPECNNEDVKIALFWNRFELERTIGGNRRCYYPQLFAGDLSNIHSNVQEDKILKYNIYNCFSDLIQSSSSPFPIKYMQLAKMTALAVSKISKTDIFKAIGAQNNRLIEEIKHILIRISSARLRNSSLRAEFRVNIIDFSSIFLLIHNKFRADKISLCFYALKMDDICDLTVFYVNLLSEPIFRSFLRIIGDTNLIISDVMKNLATIVLFESLLSFTLLSGNTYNLVREISWSTENNLNSFNLMKFIIVLNRPVFQDSKWNLANYCISEGNVQFFKDMMSRISKGDANLIGYSFELYYVLRNKNKSDNEKAEALWKAYYAALPATDLINPQTLYPWKRENLKNNIRFRGRPLTIKEAINKLFDPEMLVHCAWQKPYLIAFNELCESAPDKSKNDRKIEIKNFLQIIATKKLQLEVIRYPGDEHSFLGRGITYINISYEDHSECVSSFLTDDTAQRTSEIGAEILNSLKKDSFVRKTRGRGLTFSLDENIQLVSAYNTFGPSAWSRIIKDTRFIFSENGLRTSDNLRTRWRNMEKTLIFDRYFFIKGYERECSPKNLQNNYIFNFSSNTLRFDSSLNIINESNSHQNHRNESINTLQIDNGNQDNYDEIDGNVNFRMENELNFERSVAQMSSNETENDFQILGTEREFNISPVLSAAVEHEFNIERSTVRIEPVTISFSNSNSITQINSDEIENNFQVSDYERELALINPSEAVKSISRRIHSIYGEKYALKVGKIATEYTEESCTSWKKIYSSLSSKNRDTKSWNLLKIALLSIGLIEENDFKFIIRKY